MSVLNKNYKQVVNLAGQVSELNTSELECGTLKTSSLLANSVIPRLSNGVVKSVDYTLSIAAGAGGSSSAAVTLVDGEQPPTNAVILSASMKSTGGPLVSGPIELKVGTVKIISLDGTSVDATVVNTGGMLGEPVTDISGGAITVGHLSNPSLTDVVVTISGTVTYFEPNE